VKLVARSEALEQGLKRYFTGKPCGRGHIAERAVSHRGCLQCHADDMFIRQLNDPQHARELDARSRAQRPWDSLRHLKENYNSEEWRKKLNYASTKNQERRDYSVGTLSPDIRERLYKAQNGLCNGCGSELNESHLDHVMPLSRGGTNTDDNVQLLCPRCNLSKGTKTMEEWK